MFVCYAIKTVEKHYRRGYSKPCSRCAKLFKNKKNALNRLETLGQGKIVMIHAKLRELV